MADNIKVTVIRNAAGSQSGSTVAGCRDSAPTYYTSARLSTELPSACGANTQDSYSLSMPHKVINVMNYFGAPSSDFIAYDRSDLINPIDLQCELDVDNELVCIWKPLVGLDPAILINGLKLGPPTANKVAPALSQQIPTVSVAPKLPEFVLVRLPNGNSKLVKA